MIFKKTKKRTDAKAAPNLQPTDRGFFSRLFHRAQKQTTERKRRRVTFKRMILTTASQLGMISAMVGGGLYADSHILGPRWAEKMQLVTLAHPKNWSEACDTYVIPANIAQAKANNDPCLGTYLYVKRHAKEIRINYEQAAKALAIFQKFAPQAGVTPSSYLNLAVIAKAMAMESQGGTNITSFDGIHYGYFQNSRSNFYDHVNVWSKIIQKAGLATKDMLDEKGIISIEKLRSMELRDNLTIAAIATMTNWSFDDVKFADIAFDNDRTPNDRITLTEMANITPVGSRRIWKNLNCHVPVSAIWNNKDARAAYSNNPSIFFDGKATPAEILDNIDSKTRPYLRGVMPALYKVDGKTISSGSNHVFANEGESDLTGKNGLIPLYFALQEHKANCPGHVYPEYERVPAKGIPLPPTKPKDLTVQSAERPQSIGDLIDANRQSESEPTRGHALKNRITKISYTK